MKTVFVLVILFYVLILRADSRILNDNELANVLKLVWKDAGRGSKNPGNARTTAVPQLGRIRIRKDNRGNIHEAGNKRFINVENDIETTSIMEDYVHVTETPTSLMPETNAPDSQSRFSVQEKAELLNLKSATENIKKLAVAILNRKQSMSKAPGIIDKDHLMNIKISSDIILTELRAMDIDNKGTTSIGNIQHSPDDIVHMLKIKAQVKNIESQFQEIAKRGSLIKGDEATKLNERNAIMKIKGAINVINTISSSLNTNSKKTGSPFSLKDKAVLLSIGDAVESIQKQMNIIASTNTSLNTTSSENPTLQRIRNALKILRVQLRRLDAEHRKTVAHTSGKFSAEDRTELKKTKVAVQRLISLANRALSRRTALAKKMISAGKESSILRAKSAIESLQSLVNSIPSTNETPKATAIENTSQAEPEITTDSTQDQPASSSTTVDVIVDATTVESIMRNRKRDWMNPKFIPPNPAAKFVRTVMKHNKRTPKFIPDIQSNNTMQGKPGMLQKTGVLQAHGALEAPGSLQKPDELQKPKESVKPAIIQKLGIVEEPGPLQAPTNLQKIGASEKLSETQKPGSVISPGTLQTPSKLQKPSESENSGETQKLGSVISPGALQTPSKLQKPSKSDHLSETQKAGTVITPGALQIPSKLQKPGESENPSETQKSGEVIAPAALPSQLQIQHPGESEKQGEIQKPEAVEKPTGSQTPEVSDKSGSSEKPGKIQEPGEVEKPEGLQKPEKIDKSDKLEKTSKLDKPSKLEKPGATEKANKLKPKPKPNKPFTKKPLTDKLAGKVDKGDVPKIYLKASSDITPALEKTGLKDVLLVMELLKKSMKNLGTKLDSHFRHLFDQNTDNSNMQRTDINTNSDRISLLDKELKEKFDQLENKFSNASFDTTSEPKARLNNETTYALKEKMDQMENKLMNSSLAIINASSNVSNSTDAKLKETLEKLEHKVLNSSVAAASAKTTDDNSTSTKLLEKIGQMENKLVNAGIVAASAKSVTESSTNAETKKSSKNMETTTNESPTTQTSVVIVLKQTTQPGPVIEISDSKGGKSSIPVNILKKVLQNSTGSEAITPLLSNPPNPIAVGKSSSGATDESDSDSRFDEETSPVSQSPQGSAKAKPATGRKTKIKPKPITPSGIPLKKIVKIKQHPSSKQSSGVTVVSESASSSDEETSPVSQGPQASAKAKPAIDKKSQLKSKPITSSGMPPNTIVKDIQEPSSTKVGTNDQNASKETSNSKPVLPTKGDVQQTIVNSSKTESTPEGNDKNILKETTKVNSILTAKDDAQQAVVNISKAESNIESGDKSTLKEPTKVIQSLSTKGDLQQAAINNNKAESTPNNNDKNMLKETTQIDKILTTNGGLKQPIVNNGEAVSTPESNDKVLMQSPTTKVTTPGTANFASTKSSDISPLRISAVTNCTTTMKPFAIATTAAAVQLPTAIDTGKLVPPSKVSATLPPARKSKSEDIENGIVRAKSPETGASSLINTPSESIAVPTATRIKQLAKELEQKLALSPKTHKRREDHKRKLNRYKMRRNSITQRDDAKRYNNRHTANGRRKYRSISKHHRNKSHSSRIRRRHSKNARH